MKHKKKILKSGQIQMIETIGVLFVFFLLLGFGLIFYGGYRQDQIKKLSSEKDELELITAAQIISTMPELKCSEENSITENCYDLVAVEALSNLMNDVNGFMSPNNPYSRIYYVTTFKSANITIGIYDERNNSMNKHNIYYNREPGKFNRRTNYVPITLKDSRTGEFYFGILYLTIFL